MFTEPLPSNGLVLLHYSTFQTSYRTASSLKMLRNLRGCSVGITDGKGFMKYAIEMDSGTMI
jgi:hypothetical protein